MRAPFWKEEFGPMNMDDYLRFQRDLQKMIEQAAGINHLRFLDAEVRKVIQPFREPYQLATALGRATRDVLQQRDLARELMAATAPTAAQQLFETMERQRSAYSGYLDIARTSRPATIELFDRLQLDARDRVQDILGASPLVSPLQSEIVRIREMALGISAPTGAAALATALGGWTSVLEASQHDVLATALHNPLAESMRHFRESAVMLAAGPEPVIARAIERAVLLADVELRASSVALMRVEPTVELETTPPPSRRLLVPRIQRIELRRAADTLDENADLDDVLAALRIGQVVLVAREVVGLFLALVDEQQGSSRKPIFRMTARAARACTEMPFAVPVDRRTFADFVDDLYWLLYEAPGARALKYLPEHGGPLTQDDCETVFVIKLLRNYYRHDLEHGSDRDIEKKFAEVRDVLRARGVENPRTRTDYRTLHRVLLEEAAAFLRKLQDAL
jgi:hypothetical protein